MRILTSSLKPIQRIWSQVRVKGTQINEYVFLDFKNKTLTFFNSRTVVKAKFYVEDDEDTSSYRSMFIDGGKFFSLVQFYDYIDLDQDGVFYSSLGDKFLIPELNEEPEIADQPFDDWKTLSIEFTPELNKKLSIASTYVDADEKSDFSSLFVHNGTLIGCNRFRMLFAATDNGFGEEDFNIPLDLLRLIVSMDLQGIVDFSVRDTSTGAKMIEFSYGDIWLRYGASSRYELPFDPDSEDFRSSFDHPNFFSVKLEKLEEAIKFLSVYFNDVAGTVCQLVFDTADPNAMLLTLHLSYEDAGTSDYKIQIENCTDPEFFDGKSVYINLSFIKSAITVLHQFEVEDLRMTFDDGTPAIEFLDNKEEAPVYVVHTTNEDLQ